MRKVIMFQERFAAKVLDGTKKHTIRKAGTAQEGDLLSMRMWSGLPYKSPQVVIGEKRCRLVWVISIAADGVCIDGMRVCSEAVAKGDGFADWPEMRDYFAKWYGLPFEGDLLDWGQPGPLYEEYLPREPVPEAPAVTPDPPPKKSGSGGRSGGKAINLFRGQGQRSRSAAEKVCHMPLMGYAAMMRWVVSHGEVQVLVVDRAIQAGLVVFDPCTGLWTGTNKVPEVGWERMPENEGSSDV